MEEAIDIQEWIKDLHLEKHDSNDAFCLVLAHLLHTKLYLMGETSHAMNPLLAGNIMGYCEGIFEMSQHLADRNDEDKLSEEDRKILNIVRKSDITITGLSDG